MLKSDNAQVLKPKDFIYLLAIAGRIDAQKIPASKLTASQKKHINYAYPIVDSLSSSYSMFRYFFDVCIGGNADDLHDFMLRPGCIIGITLESIFLMGFAFFAHYFKDEKKEVYTKWIVAAWPYIRDVMKGLKNAYKGWRSTLVAIGLMGGVDLKFLIAPIGIVLGIIAALNRMLLTYINKQHTTKMEANTKLLEELINESSLVTMKTKLNKVQYQSRKSRNLAFVSVAFGGVIDGLYLYVGAVTLIILCPPILIAITSICAFYTLVCVITRLYEEYNSQLKLLNIQTQCMLVFMIKELDINYQQLVFFQAKEHKSQLDYMEICRLKKEVGELINRVESKFDAYQKNISNSDLTIFLLGMKNGLTVYGVVSSILFLVNPILLLCGIALPPVALIIGISMGLVIITGFIIHALYMHGQHLKTPQFNTGLHSLCDGMKKNIQLDEEPVLINENQKTIEHDSHEPIPELFIQEWSEVGRSLFSGLSKGQKFVDFAGNMLQERNDDGHYQDTPIMYVLGGISALLFGLIFSLKAFIKGFEKKKTGEINIDSQDDKKTPHNHEDEKNRHRSHKKGELKIFKPQRDGESKEPDKPATDSPPKYDQQITFFKPKPETPSLQSAHARTEQNFINQVITF